MEGRFFSIYETRYKNRAPKKQLFWGKKGLRNRRKLTTSPLPFRRPTVHDLSASRPSACPRPLAVAPAPFLLPLPPSQAARAPPPSPPAPTLLPQPSPSRSRSRARLEDPTAALDLTPRSRMDKGKSVVAELAASFSDVRVAPRQNPKPKSFLPSPSFCKLHALVRLCGVT